jgi:SAM-dependent methyltransferase
MPPSESQYDHITTGYTALYGNQSSTFPAAILEESNLKHVITPFLSDSPQILDLACGSGYYSRLFIRWGAGEVVGVDLSETMVAEASRVQQDEAMAESKLKYFVGDATMGEQLRAMLEQSNISSKFDIVTGTWLLNYADSPAAMVKMWRTISGCLKEGGIFIGLTIPPPLGDGHELDRAMHEEWKKYGTSGYVLDDVNDVDWDDIGFKVHNILGMPDDHGKVQDGVEFDNYYFRSGIFERTAEEGGMKGGFEWCPFVLAEETKKGRKRGYWNSILLNPHFRICVAWRGDAEAGMVV